MTLPAFESFLLQNGEALQYVGFFVALGLLGTLEIFRPRGARDPARKKRWAPNFGLTALNVLFLAAVPISGIAVAAWASGAGIGLLNYFTLPALVVFSLGFLGRTLISWLIHFSMHKVPFLWRFHKVHHTDKEIDVSTAVRMHPLEFACSIPLVLGGLVILGISPAAVLLYEIFDATMAIVTHANVRISRKLDRLLRIVIVTPDMHRIHHSAWRPETDSNFGATLSIWDFLFGTYVAKPRYSLPELELGLTECDEAEARSLSSLLTAPFRSAKIAALDAVD